MSTTLVRMVVASSLLVVSWLAFADEPQILSITESGAGAVVATVRLADGSTPKASDFRLRFDSQRSIAASEVKASTTVQPETLVLLGIDRSGSMNPNVKEIKDTLGRVLSNPPPQTKVALLAFGTATNTLQGFTNDAVQLVRAVDNLAPDPARDGKTKLFEAISGALATLKSAQGAGQKRIIIISDGKDEGSQINSPQNITRDAKELSIPIDSIGYGRLAEGYSASLRSLSDATGGKFVRAKTSAELSDAVEQLLSSAVPGPAFDVVFNYAGSGDGRVVNSAILEFAPPGQALRQHPIQTAIAAPREDQIPPGAQGTTSADKGGWVINIFTFNVDLRALLGILAAIIGLVIAWRMSRRGPEPLPAPPPPAPAPPIQPQPLPPGPARSRTIVSPVFPAPSRGQPAAFLLCINGPARGHRYSIDEPMFRIGASDTNDLALTGDDYVSGKHACIKYDSGSLYVSDLGSRNGTYLNDARLAQAAMTLMPGDKIRIGKTTLELQAEQDLAGPAHERRVP